MQRTVSHRRTAEEGEPAALQWRENGTKGDSHSKGDPKGSVWACVMETHTPTGRVIRASTHVERVTLDGGSAREHRVQEWRLFCDTVSCPVCAWVGPRGRLVGVCQRPIPQRACLSLPLPETDRVGMSEAQALRETEAVGAPAGACASVDATVCVCE